MDFKLSTGRPSRLGRYMLVVFLTVLIAPLWVTRVGAVVDLSDFSATARENDILVEWVTATELDNAGFLVLRSLSENGDYTQVSDLISPKGDQFVGADYEWVDTDTDMGVEYWYKLEAFDFQSGSQLYGPVSAIIGAPTPTWTSTATASLTPTNTNTATTTQNSSTAATSTRTPQSATRTSTATQTRTWTPRPTNTPQPSLPTSTLTSTASQLAATATRPAGSPTITFMPLPSVTFVVSLAEPGQNPSSGVADESPNAETQNPETTQPEVSWFTPQRILVISVVVLVWALLGGWFFLSMRQIDV